MLKSLPWNNLSQKWLHKQGWNHGIMNGPVNMGGETLGSQFYTKKYKQLMIARKGRISLFQGSASLLVCSRQRDQPSRHLHIQTTKMDSASCIYMYTCTHIHKTLPPARARVRVCMRETAERGREGGGEGERERIKMAIEFRSME